MLNFETPECQDNFEEVRCVSLLQAMELDEDGDVIRLDQMEEDVVDTQEEDLYHLPNQWIYELSKG